MFQELKIYKAQRNLVASVTGFFILHVAHFKYDLFLNLQYNKVKK